MPYEKKFSGTHLIFTVNFSDLKERQTMGKRKPDYVVYSPLLRFKKDADCKSCPLKEACEIDKNRELRCILALAAISLYRIGELYRLRGADF